MAIKAVRRLDIGHLDVGFFKVAGPLRTGELLQLEDRWLGGLSADIWRGWLWADISILGGIGCLRSLSNALCHKHIKHASVVSHLKQIHRNGTLLFL